MNLSSYVDISKFPLLSSGQPWEITHNLAALIHQLINNIPSSDYRIENNIAIHKSAVIENGAILKPPIIISANCFVAATAYLRGGIFLAHGVIIGPSVEVKTSFFGENSKAAHLNFVGDSVIGHHVNIEAGAMLANYRNESDDKEVYYKEGQALISTGGDKFGALVGDNTKIGANAVLVPGTVLKKNSLVRRLELVDHMSD